MRPNETTLTVEILAPKGVVFTEEILDRFNRPDGVPVVLGNVSYHMRVIRVDWSPGAIRLKLGVPKKSLRIDISWDDS